MLAFAIAGFIFVGVHDLVAGPFIDSAPNAKHQSLNVIIKKHF